MDVIKERKTVALATAYACFPFIWTLLVLLLLHLFIVVCASVSLLPLSFPSSLPHSLPPSLPLPIYFSVKVARPVKGQGMTLSLLPSPPSLPRSLSSSCPSSLPPSLFTSLSPLFPPALPTSLLLFLLFLLLLPLPPGFHSPPGPQPPACHDDDPSGTRPSPREGGREGGRGYELMSAL